MKYKKLVVPAILVGLPLLVFVGLIYLDTMRSFLFATDPNADTDEPYSIIIVAGQSNAEGSNSFLSDMPEGEEIGTHPVDDEENPDDNAQIWWEGADGAGLQDTPGAFFEALVNPQYTTAGWTKSNNTADPSKQRLINFKDLDEPAPMGQRNRQFGPEVGIARYLHDQGRRKLIFLKVTYGFQALGKSTSQFVPYDWNIDCASPGRSNKSYCHLKSAYAELTSYLRSQDKKYTVDGMFWLQGETDALDSGWTNSYLENFDDLVNESKKDMQFHPDAHFVARKFNLRVCLNGAYPPEGNFCGVGYALRMEGISISNILDALTINPLISIPLNTSRIKTVRSAIQTTADKYDWVDAVETDDLPFYPDFIHLNAEGQLGTGKRMAAMYRLPYRPAITEPLTKRNDYDGDGKPNSQEDTGMRSCSATANVPGDTKANNGNLGDDDCDGDGFPNYIDATPVAGSGMAVQE